MLTLQRIWTSSPSTPSFCSFLCFSSKNGSENRPRDHRVITAKRIKKYTAEPEIPLCTYKEGKVLHVHFPTFLLSAFYIVGSSETSFL